MNSGRSSAAKAQFAAVVLVAAAAFLGTEPANAGTVKTALVQGQTGLDLAIAIGSLDLWSE